MPQFCNCGKRATFGITEKKPTHCGKCKTSEMRDVRSKKCLCGNHPVFGMEDGKPTHCKMCKTKDMSIVISKKCLCGTIASFGNDGGKPTHCWKCKTSEMIDVRSKKCACGLRRPSFGLEDGKRTHCKMCKTPEMTNVVNKKCLCGLHRPSFGTEDGKPTHCATCKTSEMRDVSSKKCFCGLSQPAFGIKEGKPTHCRICKTDEMEDVKSRRCPGYNGNTCPTNYIIGNNEYCLSCDPDESRKLAKKRDEAAFFSFLNKTDIDITQQQYPVYFRCIDTNKTRADIDGVIITKDVVVCLELDEDAHEYYDQGCEEARMHNATAELKIAYPNHHVSWVRVNPHTKKNGKRDTSKKALKTRDQRHQEALEIIKDILQNPRDCVEYIGY
ncbi:hypothetical protein ATCVNTS1_987R [Acanthocystis turfacea Chlorella virus NTS-1]|nr:hypothetical protein ATCVNTS1_987R [Acanthocystis turfacea Chlorella virus NTS-1]